MMFLADLSGLVFLTAAGMMYASWKLYQKQEDPFASAVEEPDDSSQNVKRSLSLSRFD